MDQAAAPAGTPAKVPFLVDFVDRLYSEKDFGQVDPIISQQIKEDLYDDAKDALDTALIEAIPNELLDQYEQILDAGDTDQAVQFMHQYVPGYAEVIQQSLTLFRHGYLMEEALTPAI